MHDEQRRQEALAILQSVTLNEIEALYAIKTPDDAMRFYSDCLIYYLPMGEVREEHFWAELEPTDTHSVTSLSADDECTILAKIILPAAAHSLVKEGSIKAPFLDLPTDTNVLLPTYAEVLQSANLEQSQSASNHGHFYWVPRPTADCDSTQFSLSLTDETLQRAAAILEAFRMGVKDASIDREGPYVGDARIFGIAGQIVAYKAGQDQVAAQGGNSKD